MSMKSLAIAMPDYAASVLSAPSYLRIAVPSWRSVGIQRVAEPVVVNPNLSREEIQTLFHGELNGKARKRPKLTEREEQEKNLAKRIRRALYPFPGHQPSH